MERYEFEMIPVPAETLDAVPVMTRRLRLAVGFQYIILSLALGKCAGSLAAVFLGIGT